MARTRPTRRSLKKKKVVVAQKKPPTSLVKSLQTPQAVIRSRRDRVQTKLFQSPDAATPQVARKGMVKLPKKPMVKATKKDKNNNKVLNKVAGSKVTKTKKTPISKAASKKGNDRLTKRDGITIDKENPFFQGATVPEFVSVNTWHRWLIRALVRNNITELKNVMKTNRIGAYDGYKTFSYLDTRTADNVVYLRGEPKLIEEYFKLKEAIDPKKTIQGEPNILQRKSTGQKNFYMLGRATRNIEMSRGGREGNNAFLNYETKHGEINALQQLVERGLEYKEIMKLSQLKNSVFNMGQLESQLVYAARMGHCELAFAIASAEAQYCTNDLHRHSLKIGGKLPQKILGVSVVKKCFLNKNVTPLHTAATNPDGAKMLEQLRAADPNINIPDQDNWYTIHYAAVNRAPGALNYLLKNGASPTMLNKKHQSPLHVAAIAGRSETTKALLEAIGKLERGDSGEGPKPEKSLINARSREGDTPLLYAVKYGRADVVKALLENKTTLVDAPSSTGTNKLTPLMLACALGNLEIAQLLVGKGALIEAKDKKKRTALHHAVLNGQQHTAAYLLAMGTDLLKGDSSGNTPSHYASAYGWLNCLKLLASVDPECLSQENDWKITPLTVAFLKGHYGIVTWLLDGEFKDHVNINGKDMDGYTLLSCLLAFSDPDVHNQLPEQIEYLLSRGADCSLTDSYDNTILHDFSNLRVNLIAPGEKEKKGMTKQQYKDCFDKLVSKAPDALNMKNQGLQTPLHLALQQGNLLAFNWMLAKVDIKQFFQEKWTLGENIIHVLLNLPLIVWNGGIDIPAKELYDILPILKKFHKEMYGEFITWMREQNSAYQEPILAFMKTLSTANLTKGPEGSSNDFMIYMTDIVHWMCEIMPELPALFVEKTETRPTMSLFHTSFSIPFNDFKMMEILLQRSLSYGSFPRLLEQEIDMPIVFHAFTHLDALRKILRFARINNHTNGVHNAVKKYDGDYQDKKEINKTVLMTMIEWKAFDLINELQMDPEDWKAKDVDGNSAWHYAAKSNHHRTISLMKALEANNVPRETNNRGATPLHVAVQSCDGSADSVLEPIEWLVTKSNVADQDVFGRTAMHYVFATFEQLNDKILGATAKDPIAVVSILAMDITEKQLNVADVDGNTALHLAAACGANICAVTLLRKGAKVDVKNKDGNTPLALGILKARQGVALTLIQANSDVTGKVIEVRREKKENEIVKWIWNCLKKTEVVIPESTIPAQIVKRGLDWAAMVYVLLDTLGKNTQSLAQITACALREKQYNLANQLLKSLEALLDGKPLRCEEDLIVIFAESAKDIPASVTATTVNPTAYRRKIVAGKRRNGGHFPTTTITVQTPSIQPTNTQNKLLEAESVERTVLDRLLAIGCPYLKGDTCPALEIALFNQAWALADFFKEYMNSNIWTQLKPVHPDEGPLKALLSAGIADGPDFSRWIDHIIKLKNINMAGSYSLPAPASLQEHIQGKFTAMGWAALHGSVDLIYFLRKKGFDVNVADELGRTPIMLAILANEEKAIEALCNEKTSRDVTVKKDKNIVKMKMSLGNHLTFTLNGRKRKASDDDSDSSGDEDNSEQSESEEEEKKTPVKKFKITNKKLNLELKDKKGRNIMHYFVEPMAWENVELMNILAKENKPLVKKLLLEKDQNGQTPITLAANLKQRMMTTAMNTVSGQTVKAKNSDLPQVVGFTCPYDISADSKAYIDKFAAENDKKKTNVPEDKPWKLTGYSDSGVVVKDDKTNQYFRVLLNKSDLSYGRFGFHNFYRMELVKRRDTSLWNVFTNWGRIGAGDGEYQNTPFGNLDAAIKEFCSIFKAKTGQEWLPLDNFVDIPKKYRLVKVDKSPNSLADLELPNLKKEEEKDEIRAFVKDISDPEKLKQYQNAIRNNLSICSPFGRITKESIETARAILKDCAVVAKQILDALGEKNTNQEKLLRLLNQANDLSSEFYSVIPIGNAEYSALKRFDDESSIEHAHAQLNRMAEVEIVARILTASAHNQAVDRISYITSAMECGLRAMTPDEAISQYLLQWVHNTKNEDHQIKGIMEITPRTAVDNFRGKFANEDNQKYLLHGTRAVNLVSLLRDGFLVDPQNCQINGRLFGDGVYLADCFGKSHNYCQESARGWKYMLVCQVSFGKLAVRDKDEYQEENLKSYDSFHMKGSFVPSCAITIDGISMPLGPAKNKDSNNYWGHNYSEYIIKDPKRVLPRFIIMYK